MKVGELVGEKYRILRVLGEGGMGRVVAARHEALDQDVAIKMLLPEALVLPEAIDRFLREARAAVKLRSEHVGRVIDVGRLEDQTPYMVMEFLDGVDLHEELTRRGRLPPAEAVDYILQACEAIAEAHSKEIIHRDIKPANLFLTHKADGSPLIKVLDFGISKAAPTDPSFNLTKTNAVMGSPGYMSPEQLRSSRDVDVRTDIWSLGVVLYELVSNQPPFAGESFSHLCISIATERPRELADVGLPPALEAAVLRCLEKEPARRFQNVAELAAALSPFSERSQNLADSIRRLLNQSASPAPVPAHARPTTLGAPGEPSDSPPAIPAHAKPTTLSSAAGQQVDANQSRVRWLIGGVIVATSAAIVLVVALAVGGDDSPRPATAGSADAGPQPAEETQPAGSSEETASATQFTPPATPSVDAGSRVDANQGSSAKQPHRKKAKQGKTVPKESVERSPSANAKPTTEPAGSAVGSVTGGLDLGKEKTKPKGHVGAVVDDLGLKKKRPKGNEKAGAVVGDTPLTPVPDR